MTKKEYDVIIVGSGLGGLLCGNLLALEGYKVCVLEKHYQIGGNLQTFTREGCVFDTGMHYVGCLAKGEVMHQLFSYLNIMHKLSIKQLDIDGFDIMDIAGKEYKMAQGYNNFSNTLKNYFPNETKAIDKYVKDLQEKWNASPFLNLEADNLDDFEKTLEKQEDSAYEYLQNLTKNEELRAVLACNNGLYVGNSKKTPFYLLANINNFYIKSAWRLLEGGTQLANLLKENIENLDGKVLTKKEVTGFNFEQTNIKSAIVNGGKEEYFAKQFISNTHPNLTIDLIPNGYFRKAFVSRIKNLENTIGAFSLFIVLKKKMFKHINHNVYYVKDQNVWDINNNPQHEWSHGYILYTSPDEQGVYAKSLTLITMMSFDEVKKWENTTIEKRGETYKKFKKEKAEKLLDLVESRYPKIREKIKSYYTASPLTYRDYTGTINGSMYGIEKDCKHPLKTFLPVKNKIPNLYFTGQNINIHGMLGVAMGALITCAYFTDLKSLMKKIRCSENSF